MKERIGQVTTHATLVTEVTKQISLFIAQPILIKQRIELLIEKHIIKRSAEFYDNYEYIA